jgi:two-component system osmolarity sensor histidine kinase EnvZ
MTFLKPKSLFIRFILILFIPLLLIQVSLGYIFFERHTQTIVDTLSDAIAGDVEFVIQWHEKNPQSFEQLSMLSRKNLSLNIEINHNQNLEKLGRRKRSFLYQHLGDALDKKISKPYFLTMNFEDITIFVQIEEQKVLKITTLRKRLFSKTTPIVLIWTGVSALLLFGVAVLFIRSQIRPIKSLSTAADYLGKGDFSYPLKQEGALEIRRLTKTFDEMRQRISSSLQEKTDMLAGVSHDLKTLLTRFLLQVSLLKDEKAKLSLKNDIKKMDSILGHFLDYAKSTIPEQSKWIQINQLITDIIVDYPDTHIEMTSITALVKPITLERCLINIIDNAKQYAKNIWINVEKKDKYIVIIIDDDGPGIPDNELSNVLKPFYRLDEARNLDNGGIGLGLSIVKAGVALHGGCLVLMKSPKGGLRVSIKLLAEPFYDREIQGQP